MLFRKAEKSILVINRFSIVCAAIVIVAYFLPFSILGPDSFITIHDNLDGEFIYKYLLVTTGAAFDYGDGAVIANVMNGIPRSAFRSGLDVSLLLFYVFDPHTAYIANYVVVHLIGFFGMYLLLKRHFLPEEEDYFLVIAISLCFFFVPYYSAFGVSVAGQPFLLFAFLNILQKKQKWTDYLIIAAFPFYSHLILVAPFIATFLALLLIIDFSKTRKLNAPFLAGIGLLCVTYLAVESQLVYSTFADNSFISHRTTWNRWTDIDIQSNLRRSAEMLWETQYHTGRFPTTCILISAILAAILSGANRVGKGRFLFLVASIAAICLIAGFHDWIVFFFANKVATLKYFNISRFYFLLPLLWMLLFAMSLKLIRQRSFMVPLALGLCIAQAITILAHDDEFKNNVKLLLGRKIDQPTYSQFFAPELFSEVDRYISKPRSTYKVVSIGLHPSVSQFNGFHTLDGYQVNYSLAYKNQFRRVIARELEKNDKIREYFDDWGNRCYIFIAEIGTGQNDKVIENLELDTTALKSLGGEYIFSANEISNYSANGLAVEKTFEDRASLRRLYLYRIL